MFQADFHCFVTLEGGKRCLPGVNTLDDSYRAQVVQFCAMNPHSCILAPAPSKPVAVKASAPLPVSPAPEVANPDPSTDPLSERAFK